MRLLAVTYGTEGDTRPLVMLCHGLQAAGHEVMVLAEGGTLGSAQALGVPHAALEGDIHDEVVALVSRGNDMAAASRDDCVSPSGGNSMPRLALTWPCASHQMMRWSS